MNRNRKSNRTDHIDLAAKIIRRITVAPIAAFLMNTFIVFFHWEVFGIGYQYLIAVFCLTVLPLSAYPLQRFIPFFKNEGRRGQRNFAIIMSILGYVLSLGLSFALGSSVELKVMYLTYFLSGVFIGLFTKVFHVPASGHMCGIVGPCLIMVYFLGIWGMISFLLVPLVIWASLKTKQHNGLQLFLGFLIPVVSLFIAAVIIGF